jgi:hypothetical protein
VLQLRDFAEVLQTAPPDTHENEVLQQTLFKASQSHDALFNCESFAPLDAL